MINTKRIIILLLIFAVTIPIAVFAAPPKVKLVVTPISGDSPLIIEYDENSGDKTITNYSYDFGNGVVQYGKSGNYTYGFGGTYTLTLTVKNSLGETAQDTAIITVNRADDYANLNTTYQTVITGSTALTTAITGKTTYEKSVILADATDKDLKPVKFPFTYKIKDSEIQFDSYCCKLDEGLCGYWISAYRTINGQKIAVKTNSPVWISPPPFELPVSESYSATSNTITVTIKEDLRGAITEVIQQYTDRQPLGTPATREYQCTGI